MTGRRRAVVLLLLGAVGIVGICVAVALGAPSLSATTRPSKLEKAVAHAVLDASVRARAPRGKSAPTDPASIARGRDTEHSARHDNPVEFCARVGGATSDQHRARGKERRRVTTSGFDGTAGVAPGLRFGIEQLRVADQGTGWFAKDQHSS